MTDYRIEVANNAAQAVHVISAVDAHALAASTTADRRWPGWNGVVLGGVRDAAVIWANAGAAPFTYEAPRKPGMLHVVLDEADRSGFATMSAKVVGDHCVVQVAPGGSTPASPLIAVLDDKCTVAIDPELAAGSAAGTRPSRAQITPSPRAGCCEAQSAPGSPLAMALVVLLALWRQRARSLRA